MSAADTSGHTPRRTIRVDSGLWGSALDRAREENVRLSDVIRTALRMYVDGEIVVER